ncbi:MAG: 2,3-bisphosphoglycerate-independent phosphoglycerate mutase [Euryarchaeota archaeon]|nr:2,3-bisphosphoglycerate-independent phosphoglycerate mutase [Euryarchaeota archaeon]
MKQGSSTSKHGEKVLLVVLDGWGHSKETIGNAFAAANATNLKGWLRDRPNTLLEASGLSVGLPRGQMGNSEVGHLTIGAGRVVYQSLTRIDMAIEDRSFDSNPVLLEAMDASKGARLHVMGLVSDGGVHSHIAHLSAILRLAKAKGLSDVAVHAILDGRDTPPQSAQRYIERIEKELKVTGVGRLATVGGRYFAMDRDRRWERTKEYHDVIVGKDDVLAGKGTTGPATASHALDAAYERGETDEFVRPVRIAGAPALADGDVVLFFNFRPDRARQMTRALFDADFKEFGRISFPRVKCYTMSRYDETFPLKAAFPPVALTDLLGGVLSKARVKQLRVAETEKYAHVTYFFNGMDETPFEGEERVLVASQKVSTYDLRPEMSARAITDAVIERATSGDLGFILVNYANMDMVGHTGKFDAAVKAVEAVDSCLGEVVTAARSGGYDVLITADHGNVEKMQGENGAHTAHTSNPVPLLFIGDEDVGLASGGGHRDVAPTVLDLMGIEAPKEMTGRSILVRESPKR